MTQLLKPGTAARTIAPQWMHSAAVFLERITALGVSFLLFKSAIAQLGNPYFFLSSVYAYELVGPDVGVWVAVVLPFLQIVLSSCLLLRFFAREAYLVSGLLFLGLVAAQAAALRAGLTISCGCFGSLGSGEIGAQTLALAGSGAAASLLGGLLVGSTRRDRGGDASRE